MDSAVKSVVLHREDWWCGRLWSLAGAPALAAPWQMCFYEFAPSVCRMGVWFGSGVFTNVAKLFGFFLQASCHQAAVQFGVQCFGEIVLGT